MSEPDPVNGPNPAHAKLKEEWDLREHAFGSTLRAVLMKGVPAALNLTFDTWHKSVLRASFKDHAPGSGMTLDMGCGYGRMAETAHAMGMRDLVGTDFSPGFCRRFSEAFGLGVRADLSRLPFAEATFSSAYSVTSLMYLEFDAARLALQALDRSMLPGGRILLLEPGAEFNALVRSVLKSKANESLSRPGFTAEQFSNLAPAHWKKIAAGNNFSTTASLPILLPATKVPILYRCLEKMILALDQPGQSFLASATDRFSLYRWVLFSTPLK